ncbi:hypothetical protein B0H17DRAFT_1215316 [Mycena rosella]|uniref:Uncharacterized protein n=1 Tax=Mycena rosella TaxID=1033263 RepID=A0AAD7G0C6_MYCRO|nr:hypothetical protein B0H17DRAFT_1215316 [Mycena rosella]
MFSTSPYISKPSSSIARNTGSLAASADALPAFMAQSNNTRAFPARDKAAQRAATQGRGTAPPLPTASSTTSSSSRTASSATAGVSTPAPALLAASGGRTLPASLALLLPSFGHGSRLAVNLSGTLLACP